jgi:hypothetical protein
MRLSILLMLLLTACSSDPFDPWLGSRAERSLLTRADILASEKVALLDRRPCDPWVLQALADAPAREVRALVAANPAADRALLGQLAEDADSAVRQYVASNPTTPRDILLQLRSGDADGSLQFSLLTNPNWTAGDLREMFAEPNSPQLPFAMNRNTPPEILEQLSRSTEGTTRSWLARNPSISPSIAGTLSRDPDRLVRHGVATNAATPTSVLQRLQRDPEAWVSAAATSVLLQRSQESVLDTQAH